MTGLFDSLLNELTSFWKTHHAPRSKRAYRCDCGRPVASKTENPEQGLAFDILRSPADGPKVLTGHSNGLITLNAEEADDVKREEIRTALHEPYRTLLGHFRHEIGHYYWDRLVWMPRISIWK